jgi:hypothetical protein
MLDTQTVPGETVADTPTGPYPRLSPAAVERAKIQLGITDLATLGTALGFNGRMTFWRARRGEYDIPLSHASRLARQLGMPLDQLFDGGSNA